MVNLLGKERARLKMQENRRLTGVREVYNRQNIAACGKIVPFFSKTGAVPGGAARPGCRKREMWKGGGQRVEKKRKIGGHGPRQGRGECWQKIAGIP
jgi:hypothetical protein